MTTLWQDVKYALRMLVRSPGFTAVAVISLALGIGANTAIFSVVNAVLLRPLPFRDPDRLVKLWESEPKEGLQRSNVSYPNCQDWREQNHVFEDIALVGYHRGALASPAGALHLDGAAVSSNLFSLLGIKPVLGRAFVSKEDIAGSERIMILTYSLWQRHFSGDEGIVGKQVKLDADLYTVVGVMPSTFQSIGGPLENAEFLTSLAPLSNYFHQRGACVFQAVGRLKPHVTLVQAQSEMTPIATRLAKEYPANRGREVTVVSLQADIVRDVRTALWVLLGAVGFILLIVCANLANLLLARASGREGEMAIRAALGAGATRLIRQTLSESLLLALLGGALGLVLALWGVELLRPSIAAYIPRAEDLHADWTVLGFTLVISMAAGLLFGCAPTTVVLGRSTFATLQKGAGRSRGARHRTLQDVLVTAEIAITLVLLIGAGLLGRSFVSVMRTDLGLEPKNVLTFTAWLPTQRYRTIHDRQSFWRKVIGKTETLPGVTSVGATGCLPFRDSMSVGFEMLDSRPALPDEVMTARLQMVSTKYFQTIGASLVKGRFFDAQDMDRPDGKIIINETMAKRFWRDEDPIGRHLRLQCGFGENEPASYEIVGIIRDAKQEHIEAEVMPEVSVPFTQLTFWNTTFVVKAAADPMSLIGAVRKTVTDLDPDVPVSDMRTMDAWIAAALARRRFSLLMFGTFSLLALFLAGIGVYGVMAYAVSVRYQEIGIRMALGAQKRDVLGLILKRGLLLAIIGGAAGMMGAAAVTRVLGSMLYQVPPTDPLTFGAGALILLIVALSACYLPARRAAKTDPMVALRYE
jgi:putative ABC transport system permease protein